MSEEALRRAPFEKWIADPPYERSCARFPNDPDKGQYKDIYVQLAWDAWRAAQAPEPESAADYSRRVERDLLIARLEAHAARDLRGQAPEPVAQEPGRSDSAPGLFQAAAEWLAQYAGEIQASHYMPAQNRWDDEAAHRDFDGLRETAKALDAAQGQWDALVRERNRISALHAESQREIDRLYPAGMDAARAKAIERPINALLEGPAGLYGTGDARHPDKLVPVYKNSSGQVWSMTLDAVLRPDGWHADAVVYGGPIAPPCWSLATKGAEK